MVQPPRTRSSRCHAVRYVLIRKALVPRTGPRSSLNVALAGVGAQGGRCSREAILLLCTGVRVGIPATDMCLSLLC